MSIFTVLDVSPEVRRFASQHGEMTSYRMHLRNGDGTEHLNVELVRKATSTAPKAGDEYEGSLEDRAAHGLKLNLAYGGGGGSGGSGPEDPLRQKRIVRQHSQSMAIQTISLAIQHGITAEPYEDGRTLLDAIFKLADRFDADVERAAS